MHELTQDKTHRRKTVSFQEFTVPVDYSQAFKFSLALEMRARFFRFLPETSADLACMRVELYGYEGERNVLFYANYFITTLPYRRALFAQI